ncbi:MAG TPA: thioredoxin family protein [Bacilli bacterium]|nr:thioredoxin family protein [Bacilli bacterium]
MKNKKQIIIIGILLIVIIASGLLFYIKQHSKEQATKFTAITGAEFKAKIKAQDSFILVIYKDGCTHCEDYLPVFTDIAQKYNITAYKLNLTTLSSADYSYLNGFVANIGTPLTMFFEKGTETSSLNRIEGNVARDKIISRLKVMGYIQ